jgi:hypothetical protein
MTLRALGLVLLAPLAAAPALVAAQALPAGAEWREARWGMTAEQVLRAFPGEAKLLEQPIALADGNVVAAGIERHVVAGTAFRVRFVFDGGGKLVLVSLRTDEGAYAGADRLGPIEAALAARLGPPADRAAVDDFVDQRQVTWRTSTGRVDLKYIPGVVVILHAAPGQQAPKTQPAPRVER